MASRRTQRERSEATRTALLDATIECLAERGYAATTTLVVAERAGVSRGAHLHHFGTRAGLIGAAVRRYAERFGAELERRAALLPPSGRDRLARALDLLWEPYTDYFFRGAIDLWAAARTDPELLALLEPLERDLDRGMLRLCAALFPEHARRPGFERLVEFVVSTIRGLSLRAVLVPGEAHGLEARWAQARARLVRVLEDELRD